ncbi:putative uncharacterized protein DDB_G0271606 [Anastrepha ludens]|uniref:putative uncharacterized protein DDB_G0271606 n=1 Tax=Anastrepha ludens TaxID=28586 RepID=UPI0023B0DB76|nr:putative uncharacterized protein DDB_G0271606 [Anastrepha ludens]
MNIHLFWLPLLLALLFVHTPADGAKQEKSLQNDDINASLATPTTASSDTKTVLKDNLTVTGNSATAKITEKASYPKKVHSLKKRPTKTSASHMTTASTQNSKNKRKKVTADVTAAFKDLPADDLEFIKELDKQFQLHGEKIKIKVEHDNSTGEEKQTSKRTIDGELGYGAYPAHNGYEYERPKFMFYPYSQHNIPADAPGYYPPKTDVSIEPSYSYELQPQSYTKEPQPELEHSVQQPPKVVDVPQYAHQAVAHQGQNGAYEEPVIVLRIPGPTKYASHLQTLLQQYLEIRAAQYLRILEEAEHHKQQAQLQPLGQHHQEHQLLQHQHQQQQQQQHEQHAHVYEQQVQQQHAVVAPAQAYAEPTLKLLPPTHAQHTAPQPAAEEEHGYTDEVTYAHQLAPTPQSVAYPEIDDVYQGYKGKLQAHKVAIQQQHHQQAQEEAEHPQQLQHEQRYFVHAAQQPAVQQYYYAPEAQFDGHGGVHYQNVYFMAIAPQGAYNAHAAHATTLQHQPIYVQEEEQELQQHHYQHQHEQSQQQLHLQEQEQEQQHEQQHELAAAHDAHAAAALNENSPRQTHTKVIYTHNSEKGAADYAAGYALPSIRPFERHAGTSATAYHHQQQLQAQLLHEEQHEQLEQQQQHEPQIDYDTPPTHAAPEHEQSAAISPRPFNYHAHSAKAARRGNRKRGARTPTTIATPTVAQVDEHLQKIREYVRDNLGAQMSTAVEFKTTALVRS